MMSMRKVYVVRWRKVSGKFTEWNVFLSRQSAVHFLNHLILDKGESDARIKVDTVTDEWFHEYFGK